MNNLANLNVFETSENNKPYRFGTDLPILGIDGNWYVLEKIPEGQSGFKTDVECSNRVLTAYNSIPEMLADPGIYTWVLFRDNSFRAVKVITMNEICGKHMTIHKQVEKPLVLAGEAWVEGSHVRFNFLSGTYMSEQLTAHPDRLVSFSEKMKRRFLEAGASSVHLDTDLKTYVTAENLPVTMDTLHMYADAGFSVYRFGPGKDGMKQAYIYSRNKYQRMQNEYIRLSKWSKRMGLSDMPPFETWVMNYITEKDKEFMVPRESIPHEKVVFESRIRQRAHPNLGSIVPGFKRGNVFRTVGGTKRRHLRSRKTRIQKRRRVH